MAEWSDLGLLPYREALEIQKGMAKRRADGEIPDTILFCQHHPIIHFSANSILNSFSEYLFQEMRAEKRYDKIEEDDIISFLKDKGIDFGRNIRGGGGAYIGPGQVVVYPIVDYENITGSRAGIGRYKDMIDEIMKDVLEDFGIDARIYRNSDHLDMPDDRNDRKDVWVMKDDKPYKLGGKTIITSNNIAYHGFCFYLDKKSTEGFKYVNPCGHTSDELGIENVENCLGKKVSHDEFKQDILKAIKNRFGYEAIERSEKIPAYKGLSE